ncbi:MAG TPA: hypothetical protein VJO34_05330 [Methylomirabilota bacterium]|nr:hypothetical protein [Methylomirabilota bacterium]
MNTQGAGGPLILAGMIVMLIGIGVGVIRTLGIPGYWTPVAVGLVLVIAGWFVRRQRGSR